jgi:hypothetical protein
MGKRQRAAARAAFGAAAALLAVATPASASTVVDLTAVPYGAGGAGGGIHVGSLGVAGYGPTGRFDVSGTFVGSLAPFIARTFCIDVTTPFYTTANANRFAIQSLAAFSADPVKQAQVAALLLNTQALIDSAPNAGAREVAAVATGLAVWEILYEPGTVGYSVSDGMPGSGNFFAYGDFNRFQATANSYLANVENGSWTGSTMRLRTLVSVTENSQNQIFIASVPEPGTWTMLIGGFALIGAALRRRTRLATRAV